MKVVCYKFEGQARQFSKARSEDKKESTEKVGRERTYKKAKEAKDNFPYFQNCEQLGMAQVQSCESKVLESDGSRIIRVMLRSLNFILIAVQDFKQSLK